MKQMIRKMVTAWALACIAAFAASAPAATYYVDFKAGNDAATGVSSGAPFQHCPGDPAAKAPARAAVLAPGDTVIFKGGVGYLGAVFCKISGAAGNPITFDGNTAGTFGAGRALIDGSEPVTGWKRCVSAGDAQGNPRWKDIFYADVPRPRDWHNVDLCEGLKPLPVAQEPKPTDAFFQENPADYWVVKAPMTLESGGAKVFPEPGTTVNSQRPVILAFTGTRGSTVVSPVIGAAISVELPRPVTVTEVGIAMAPHYTAVKTVEFLGDGKELLEATLKKNQAGLQKFALAAPATCSQFTVKLLSTFEPIAPKADFTAIAQMAAFDAQGSNVLALSSHMALSDPVHLVSTVPDYYKGMSIAFHGAPNWVYYLDVDGYDPVKHQLELQFSDQSPKQTQYALFNSVKLISVPGEYSIGPTANPKIWRIFLLPEKLQAGGPADIRMGARGEGIALHGASHIVVQGFAVRGQSNASRVMGISALGPAEDDVIRNCEVSLVRGDVGIYAGKVNHVLVENCSVHDCPGHTKGMVMQDAHDVTVRGCRLVRNSNTGLDYYTVDTGVVSGNTVLDHRGMHANGLTFYVGCKNIIIERNRVATSNIQLTLASHGAENFIIRNNLFDAGGGTMCIGVWPGLDQPIENIQILNNTLVGVGHKAAWEAALFTNAREIQGLVVENNIIDGLGGGFAKVAPEALFRNNLYIALGTDRAAKNFAAGEIQEPDAAKIFVDPSKGDYHLKAGSPAIAAGFDSPVKTDFDDTPRPQGKPADIGAFAYKR